MTNTLATTAPAGVSAQQGGGAPARPQSGALAAPGGTGAAGAANLSMVRMAALLEQAQKALLILQDVGNDLRTEVAVTGDMAERLTASFGERMSLEQLGVIANMLTQIAEGSLNLITQGHDAVYTALRANFEVLVRQEALHATGADGAWVDSQRRAG